MYLRAGLLAPQDTPTELLSNRIWPLQGTMITEDSISEICGRCLLCARVGIGVREILPRL